MTTNGMKINKNGNGRMEIYIDYVDEIYDVGDETIYVINGKEYTDEEIRRGNPNAILNIGYVKSMTI